MRLFVNFNEEEKKHILSLTEEKNYKKGEIIFNEGDKGESLYIIAEGSVRISTFIDGIGEETLAILHAGEILGEMAIIDRSPRSATAIVNEDSILLVMSQTAFYDLINSNKETAVKILKELISFFCNRFKNTCENLKSLHMMNRLFH